MAVSKKVKANESTSINIPAEPTIGLLLGVIHVGTHKNTFKGVTSHVDQVLLQFELQDVLTDKGTPVVFGKLVRNSMHEKSNMIKLAKAMGANVKEGVDFEELVGKPVILDMQPTTSGKIAIKGYTKPSSRDLAVVKPLMGTPRLLLDVDTITDAQKSELPEWVRKLIDERENGSVADSGDEDEDLSAVDL